MARVISSVAGTRTEPKDSYEFVAGTTAVFKIIYTNNGRSVTVDTSTIPTALIMAPAFTSPIDSPLPQVLATLNGSLVPGQDFEYQFTWDIPANLASLDNYVVSFYGMLGAQNINFGDEYFTLVPSAGMTGTLAPTYATVDDVRKHKFNIDTYMPEQFRKDLDTRNSVIQEHLNNATDKLREELNLARARGFTSNYRLFCIYYAVWSILLASRGEDGSSVSSENLTFWRAEWERILSQEKRKSVMQGVPMGRG